MDTLPRDIIAKILIIVTKDYNIEKICELNTICKSFYRALNCHTGMICWHNKYLKWYQKRGKG